MNIYDNHISDAILSARLETQLDSTLEQQIDWHIANCSDCAARYRGLRTVRAGLQALRQVMPTRDMRLTIASLRPTSYGQYWIAAALILAGVACLYAGIVIRLPGASGSIADQSISCSGCTPVVRTALVSQPTPTMILPIGSNSATPIATLQPQNTPDISHSSTPLFSTKNILIFAGIIVMLGGTAWISISYLAIAYNGNYHGNRASRRLRY
jgi:predicted anti-sigma-YlaC factor YlaD